MRIRRRKWDGEDAASEASSLREELIVTPERLGAEVARIIADVAARGDAALRELTARFDATQGLRADLRVSQTEIQDALENLDPPLLRALELAERNARAVAEAELETEPVRTRLDQGQEVTLSDRPVTSAGIYAPGGRSPYPSSVLMGCVPARSAGVERIVLVTPPGPAGNIAPVVLAAAALAGADEVHACGGAQAIAALALGTETIKSVDVIAGPGNAWVTEAKRQLYGKVGVDGLAGPSELVVVADHTAGAREVALDAMAQAEHGADSSVLVLSAEEDVLDAVADQVERLAPERPSVADAVLALVLCPELQRAVQLADCFAPEHLELRFAHATVELAAERTAGCVFVGEAGATAFGDYAAGSNHVLPTGGAARFGGPLGARTFLRRTAVVDIPGEAADGLAPAVEHLAQAEGFPVHGESARARASAKDGDLQVDSR